MTKEDIEAFYSLGHPDLNSGISPQTSKANKALMEERYSKQAAIEVNELWNPLNVNASVNEMWYDGHH